MTLDTIPHFIKDLSKPDEILTVMDNAKIRNRMDVYWAAFRRFCEVEGKDYSDPLLKDFYSMLAAYEALLFEKHERKVSASRTRQKLVRHGERKCLEDWALAKKETPGFLLLIEKNMPEYTAEAVVVKHAHMFSDDVVSSAKKRLLEFGVDITKLKA